MCVCASVKCYLGFLLMHDFYLLSQWETSQANNKLYFKYILDCFLVLDPDPHHVLISNFTFKQECLVDDVL